MRLRRRRPPSSPTIEDTDEALIRLVGVSRTFPGSPPVLALRQADLEIYPGDYVAIVGPSGSGKSTLLNILGCLDRHTGGQYFFEGLDIATLSDTERTALRGQRIGFVFQSFHLLPHRTVLENVMLAEMYNRIPRGGRRERALSALERVGLSHRVSFRPGLLSGGERQRTAIARALVSEPALLLCDEPTGNLDTRNTAAILDLFDELQRGGITIAVITHDPVVSARAQRTLRIIDGILGDEAALDTMEPRPLFEPGAAFA